MAIKNCKECGKIYSHPTSPICSECKKEDELEFEKVRDYLRENANAGVNLISERTGVSVNKINRYIKNGRLLAVGIKTSMNALCERCNASIEGGRYCDSCKLELHKEMQGEKRGADKAAKKPTKKVTKMHLYDRIKKRK